jgi:hypothetical protein
MEDEERNPVYESDFDSYPVYESDFDSYPVYESDFDSLLEHISMISIEPPTPCPVCKISGEGWQCPKMYYHVNCLPCECGKDVSKPEAFRFRIDEDGPERVYNCTCLDEIDPEVRKARTTKFLTQLISYGVLPETVVFLRQSIGHVNLVPISIIIDLIKLNRENDRETVELISKMESILAAATNRT